MTAPIAMHNQPFVFETSAETHVGLKRSENQDDVLVHAESGLWAVADGVGGLKDGRLASSTLVSHLATIPPARSLTELVRLVRAGAEAANHALVETARSRGVSLGTTLVALAITGGEFACIWAGDSRLYLVRNRQIHRISEDHSEALELVRQGVLTHEEARVWPRRNVITRALGVEETIDLEASQGTLEDDDVFLLCSDGLTTHLEDHEILGVIGGRPLRDAAHALVEATLARGASDNVSVIVVGVRSAARRAGAQAQRENTVYVIPRTAPRD